MQILSPRQLYLYAISGITLIMVVYALFQLGQHVVNLLIPIPQIQPPVGKLVPTPVNFNQIIEKRGIISSLIQIIIAFPLYWYHWRLARKLD